MDLELHSNHEKLDFRHRIEPLRIQKINCGSFSGQYLGNQRFSSKNEGLISKQDFRNWANKSVKDLQLQEAVISWEVAHEMRYTLSGHRDPADRFFVATAKVYDMTLVTADEGLMSVPGLSVLPNR